MEMNFATIRFYAELNDFLPQGKKQIALRHGFWGQPAVKDLIESLGVPHTEIDLILVDDEPVDFMFHLAGGERVAVFPVFKTLDISALSRVQPEQLTEVRFVLDVHLRKLASYLRMLGFDALFLTNASDDVLIEISVLKKRILLTRDRDLLKRSKVVYAYCVRSLDPVLQISEVLRRFDLIEQIKPFERCMQCNGELMPVDKKTIIERLPPRVRNNYDDFHICSECQRVYWKGTHFERMSDFISWLQAR